MAVLSPMLLSDLTECARQEFKNHLAYLASYSWAASTGLMESACLFKKIAASSHCMAMKLVEYIGERNFAFNPSPLSFSEELSHALPDSFENALEREMATTRLFQALAEKAQDAKDFQLLSWIYSKGIFDQQTKNENLFKELLDCCDLLPEGEGAVRELDSLVGARYGEVV